MKAAKTKSKTIGTSSTTKKPTRDLSQAQPLYAPQQTSQSYYAASTGRINALDITNNPSFYSNMNREMGFDKYPILTQWFYNPILGQPRGVNISDLRSFCKSHWVRSCTNTIIDELMSMGWDIVAENLDDERRIRIC